MLMKKIITNLLGFSAILIGLISIFTSIPAAKTCMVFLAGFLCLVFSDLEKVAEISLGKNGFKLKMLIKKAESTIFEIKILAEILAKTTLFSVKKISAVKGFYSLEEENFIKDQIVKSSQSLGITQTKIDEILKENWYKWDEYRYVLEITRDFEQLSQDNPLLFEQQVELRKIENLPTPDDLIAFFKKDNRLTEVRKQWIQYYDHYVKNREHLNVDAWKNRKSQAHLGGAYLNG